MGKLELSAWDDLVSRVLGPSRAVAREYLKGQVEMLYEFSAQRKQCMNSVTSARHLGVGLQADH